MKVTTEFPAAPGIVFGPRTADSLIGKPVDYEGEEVGTIIDASVVDGGSAFSATIRVFDEDMKKRFLSGSLTIAGDAFTPRPG